MTVDCDSWCRNDAVNKLANWRKTLIQHATKIGMFTQDLNLVFALPQ